MDIEAASNQTSIEVIIGALEKHQTPEMLLDHNLVTDYSKYHRKGGRHTDDLLSRDPYRNKSYLCQLVENIGLLYNRVH